MKKKLEKMVKLESDQVFRHAVPYSDQVDYEKRRVDKGKMEDEDESDD